VGSVGTVKRNFQNYGGYVFRNGVFHPRHTWVNPIHFNKNVSFFYEMAQGIGKPPDMHILLGEGEVMVGFEYTEACIFYNYGEESPGPFLKKKSLNKYICAGEIEGYKFLLWYYNPRDIRMSCYLVEPDGTRWEGICGYKYGPQFSSSPPDTIPFP